MEVVKLETAKKLKRLGWKVGQTKKAYKKHSNCSVYDLGEFNKFSCDYDAPTMLEMSDMLVCLNHIARPDCNNVEEFAHYLIGVVQAHKKIKGSGMEQFSIKDVF